MTDVGGPARAARPFLVPEAVPFGIRIIVTLYPPVPAFKAD